MQFQIQLTHGAAESRRVITSVVLAYDQQFLNDLRRR
jgi:hypothetical protein